MAKVPLEKLFHVSVTVPFPFIAVSAVYPRAVWIVFRSIGQRLRKAVVCDLAHL